MNRTIGAGLLGCAVGALAMLGGIAAPTGAGAARASGTVLQSWMIARQAVNLIDKYMGNSKLATNAFDVSTTAEVGGVQHGWLAQSTATFTAFGPASGTSSFQYAVAHGTVPAGTSAVMYDDESWSLTPANERANPGQFMAAFVTLAHQHGYKAILAPAIDLARSMRCYKPADSAWVNYVTDCNLPRAAAQAGPDVYEIQSQRYESDTPLGVACGCYEWLVVQSAEQARTVSPLLEILAGLSTNQDGAISTPQALYTDTMHTQGAANGYWLNLPQRSTKCPKCVPDGAPQVAVGYLEMLGYSAS